MEFPTTSHQQYSPLVSPRYLAGFFDSTGSIFCIHREARNPQLRATITEKDREGKLLTAVCLQYKIGRVLSISDGRGVRLSLTRRADIKVLVTTLLPHCIVKRRMLEKSMEVIEQMELLDLLRSRRPPAPIWDAQLESDFEVALLDLYDLVAEHDAIRTGRNDA